MSRRRSYHGPSEGFKYLDKEIMLVTDGKYYVPAYSTTHDTLDEAKAEIKSRQVKRDKATKIKVWLKDSRWSFHDEEEEWKQGETTGYLTGSRMNEVVVMITDDQGRVERRNIYASNLYEVNEQNDAIISQIRVIDEQIKQLRKSRSEWLETLTTIRTVNED